MDMDNINWGFGAIDMQELRTYEWVASPMPNHYNDIFADDIIFEDAKIIQPQTGVVNSAPTTV